MKKRLIKISALLLITVLVLSSCGSVPHPDSVDYPNETPVMKSFTGVWIATVYNINFPSAPDLGAEELKEEIDAIIECCLDTGIDTVFFQARGTGDGVLYSSNIFPTSEFLSSGETPLDPLEYLVKSAHEKSIAVHAWVNPLRASLNCENAIPRPELAISYNGMRYYDCGLPETRSFVCESILEIIRNYDVDGVIFDDYFYPYPDTFGTVFEDGATFEKYGADYEDIGDFRRASVNAMVQDAHDCIKRENKEILFGISPFGIWKNGSGGEDGSATYGMESYYTLCCDTLAFVKGGYVDYIAPQLYWAENYEILYDWWEKMLKDTDVKLSVSLAASRYENDWENPRGIISSQEIYAKAGENYGGCIYYGYNAIKNNVEGLKDEIKELHEKSE